MTPRVTWWRRANSGVWRFDHDVERFLRIAGPGEYVPPSEPDSALSMSYRQRISGFDPQAYTEHVWINHIAGQDEEHKEKLKEHISALKAELLERAPSFVERLLVDRVVICQLQLLFAGSILQKTAKFSDDQATHARKCMDSAHRRERAAIRALAAVRNLLRLPSNSVKTPRLSPGLEQRSAPVVSVARLGGTLDPAGESPARASGETASAASGAVPRSRRGQGPKNNRRAPDRQARKRADAAGT